MRIPALMLALAGAPGALAAEHPAPGELVGAEIEPLNLEEIIVTGQRFTFEQELELRMIREALTNKKSDDCQKRDERVCWFERPVGTHLTYLRCARNGDLWALRPFAAGRPCNIYAAPAPPGRRYGTIWESRQPVKRSHLEAELAKLPGSEEFDREFIGLARAGEQPPRDIPDEDELDTFAVAYRAVNTLAAEDADDDTLEAAIETSGLSLERYNRIVDLIGTYDSLLKAVGERLE